MEDNIFLRWMTEAPEDEDSPPDMGDDSPPDANNSPDDQPDDSPDPAADADNPPDMGDDDYDSGVSYDDEPNDSGEEESQEEDKIKGLDNKVSNILNDGLYQKMLSLLTTVIMKQGMLSDNLDFINTLDPNSVNMLDDLKSLERNIREYNERIFPNENYSKNLLFYNTCLNLFNQITIQFGNRINDSIKNSGKKKNT